MAELAPLTTDDDWLVTQRALDLMEKLAPVVRRYLENFERSKSKALQARARNIRARLKQWPVARSRFT
ncbi:MAG: hypothetical protein ABR582_01370 [Gemmatimonadaceae bacterium]